MEQKPDKKFLKFTVDFTFKELFKRHVDLTQEFLQRFLPLPPGCTITEVTIKDPHLSPEQVTALESGEFRKFFILDLLITISRTLEDGTTTDEIVFVEMQTTSQPSFTDRIIAYTGRAYSEQLERGDDYQKLKRVYSLIFVTKNLKAFSEVDEYYHLCDIRRIEAPHLTLSSGMQFIVIELGKSAKDVNAANDLREIWCYFLKNSEELSELEIKLLAKKGGKEMSKALKYAEELSQDERFRRYENTIEKGRREGREEGIEKGREEGIEEMASAMLAGGAEVTLVARVMLAQGAKISSVAKITKLSKDEVVRLEKM